MKATDIVSLLKEKYKTVHFATYEELGQILDNSDLPCVAVIPLKKVPRFVGDQFVIREGVVIAYLDKTDLDVATADIYSEIYANEQKMLGVIYPIMSEVENLQIEEEINKFDAGLIFCAVSFDLKHYINFCS